MVGKSQELLFERLGIRPGDHILILNPPDHYPVLLGTLPPGISYAKDLHTQLDFIQYFARSRGELVQAFPALKTILAKGGRLWISWPDNNPGPEADLNESIVREIGSSNGLVDTQKLPIDADWWAVKFVHPEENLP